MINRMLNHKHLYFSFHYAIAGVWYAVRYNQNMRIHFIAAIIVLIAAYFFKVTGEEMAILGVMILLVIGSEMINTAIEEMVDLITKEHHEEAKVAKDVSAGMVLVTAIGAVIIGLFIFVPHIVSFFQ